jgi:hypothetical protein
MGHKRLRLRWWNVWEPLLLLGGLLVLEDQAPLSPGGHQIAVLAIALLVIGWLWCTRGVHVIEDNEREQAQEGGHLARQHRHTSARSDHRPGDDAGQSLQRHE